MDSSVVDRSVADHSVAGRSCLWFTSIMRSPNHAKHTQDISWSISRVFDRASTVESLPLPKFQNFDDFDDSLLQPASMSPIIDCFIDHVIQLSFTSRLVQAL